MHFKLGHLAPFCHPQAAIRRAEGSLQLDSLVILSEAKDLCNWRGIE
jgi:hypothetical protein